MNPNLTETSQDNDLPDAVPVPRSLVPHFDEFALLLDIDGTLLDLAPTPREVWVPPDLAKTLPRLLARTGGALALVSGRSVNDIDLISFPRSAVTARKCGCRPRVDRCPATRRQWTRN